MADTQHSLTNSSPDSSNQAHTHSFDGITLIPDPTYAYGINLRAGQSFENKTPEPIGFITRGNWGPYGT